MKLKILFAIWIGISSLSISDCIAQEIRDSKLTAATVDANQLMQQAREARHVWNAFPGFSADIAVSTDSKPFAGSILVTSDFDYELTMDDAAIQPWIHSKLTSVIGHRKPSASSRDDQFQVDGQSSSGVRISQGENAQFLLQDNVIREVHRKSDSHWFEISTLEVDELSDGKNLPKITSVTYRDPKSGNITKVRTNRFTWVNVGTYYLPESCFTIETGPEGTRQTREIVFTNHKLTTTPTIAANSEHFKLHQPLPEPLTSFGAAVLGEYLYVFSGHSGDAHGFGKDLLVEHFRRIKFDDPAAQWEELAMHDSAQSTALVTDGKYLYRIGGLSFLNRDGEEKAIFNSTSYFSRYDVEKDEWTELAELPEPRSSLDAAVVGRTVYAVGGWNLQGESSRDAPWHDSMVAFDLDHPENGWTVLDGPGYSLRAISVAAHNGKLYALGGIGPEGFIRTTSVYDPKSDTWSEGPELVQDSAMTGFATSTFAVGGNLYSTGASGVIYRLSEDGNTWAVADRLLYPRMFLRLLPVGNDRLIALGGTGASGAGRMAVVESLTVDPQSQPQPKVVSWSVPYQGRAKHSQAFVLDGLKLYAFGGNASWSPHDFSEEAFVQEAFVFDIGRQSAKKIADMPFAVQSGAGVVNRQTSEHKTFAIAGGMNFGKDTFRSLKSILQYDPEADNWSQPKAELPSAVAMANAVAHDDAIWMFGGSNAGGHHGLHNNVLHWWGDESEMAALPNVEIPHPRRSFGGATVGDEYYMIGGLGDGTSIESTIDVFNFKDRTWRTAASPAKSRVFPSVCENDGKVFLWGGFTHEDGHFSPCNVLEVYNSETDTWTTVADSISQVTPSMKMFDLSGRLLFFGIDQDSEAKAKFVLYDPNPAATPETVASVSFSNRRRENESLRNAKMLMRKDTDKDGLVSFKELGKRMREFAKSADKNGDKKLTFDEVKSQMEADSATPE